MSLTPVTPSNPLPPILPETSQADTTPTAEPKKITQSQYAALCYLLGKDDPVAVKDALDHLTAICWKACRGLFIPDGYREYTSTGEDHYERDNTATTRLRSFISEWLFGYFKPYNDASVDEIQTGVNDFRHIGRKCRNALLNVLRKCGVCGKRKVKQCLACHRLLTHREMNRKHQTCPHCALVLKGNNRLVCRNGCEPLSIRTSLDVCYLEEDSEGASLGESLTATKPPSLEWWLAGSEPALERLGIYEGCRAFIAAFARGGIREVAAVWCQQEGICDKTARRRRQKFLARVQELKEHKLVRELYRLIEANSDGVQVVLAVEESKGSEARQAKSEAARQLADFNKTISPEAQVEAEEAVNEFLVCEGGKDSDEINSRRNPEIASATRFIRTDGGFGEIQRQEEAETLIAEVDRDDVAYTLGLDSAAELDAMSPEEIANALCPIEHTYAESEDEYEHEE